MQYCNKLTAVLFTGLFVFIHAEKLLHEHSYNVPAAFNTDAQPVSHDHTCTICEFQLAGDADTGIEIAVETILRPGRIATAFLPDLYFNPYLLQFAGRGPPVLI